MKKIIVCCACLFFLFLSIFTFKSALFAEEKTSSGFAVVNCNNAYLYRTPTTSENYINKFFLLEESYFVKVISQPNDEFFEVEYLNIKGYVKVDALTFVVETPINPYLDYVTLDLSQNSSVKILKSPNGKYDDFNVLYEPPENAKNLLYLGKISAVEQEDFLGNVWYYCSYTLPSGATVLGYIYAPYCQNISPINKNSEVLTATSISSFTKPLALFSLKVTSENIIIVCTTIPAIAFVIILSFPHKRNKSLNYIEE